METNTTLLTRFGGGGQSPDVSEMKAALKELFVEDNPHCTEADYAEHPEASLSYGHDHPDAKDYIWTVYTIAVFRNSTGTYFKYRDQDDSDPEFEIHLDGLDEQKAMKLWTTLAAGNTAAIQDLIKMNS